MTRTNQGGPFACVVRYCTVYGVPTGTTVVAGTGKKARVGIFSKFTQSVYLIAFLIVLVLP